MILPGLSPSRLSMFLRRVLVFVGSSGACWMEPKVAFFPFFPSSFSTSDKDKSKFEVRAKNFAGSLNAEKTDHQRCWTPGTWSQRLDVFQRTTDVLQGSTSNLTEKESFERYRKSNSGADFFFLNHETVLLLTGCHELIHLLRAAFWSVHAIIFLQQLIHEGQIDTRVGRHTVGGNFPQQDAKC